MARTMITIAVYLIAAVPRQPRARLGIMLLILVALVAHDLHLPDRTVRPRHRCTRAMTTTTARRTTGVANDVFRKPRNGNSCT